LLTVFYSIPNQVALELKPVGLNRQRQPRSQGGGRSGANAVLVAANVALIYGGEGSQPYDGTSKLPDRGAAAAADGMPAVTDGPGSHGTHDIKGAAARSLPFIVQLLQDCSAEVKAQAAGAVKCLALPTKVPR
jgi:hypothetical protein